MAYDTVGDRLYGIHQSMESAFRDSTRSVSALAQFLAETRAAALETSERLDALWLELERLEPTAERGAAEHGACTGCLGCTTSLDDAADGYNCDANGSASGANGGPAWGGSPGGPASSHEATQAIQGQINWLSAINDIRNDIVFKGNSMLERVAEPPAVLLTAPLERRHDDAAGPPGTLVQRLPLSAMCANGAAEAPSSGATLGSTGVL
jgi:hypothetical protein